MERLIRIEHIEEREIQWRRPSAEILHFGFSHQKAPREQRRGAAVLCQGKLWCFWPCADEMKRRGKQHGKRTDGLVFIGKIKCANCGGTFSRFVWYSTDKYKTIVLHCYNRYTGKNKRCQTGNFREEDIKDLCLKEINSFFSKERLWCYGWDKRSAWYNRAQKEIR